MDKLSRIARIKGELIGNTYLEKEWSIPREKKVWGQDAPDIVAWTSLYQLFERPFCVWHVFRRSTRLCRYPKMLPTLSCWIRYSKIITCPDLIKIWAALIASCPNLIQNLSRPFFGFSTQAPLVSRRPLRVFTLASPFFTHFSFLLFH